MPKLKAPERGRTSTVSAALDAPTRRNLRLYARMLGASEEYVVVEALKDLFRGDPDFAAWVRTNGYQGGAEPEDGEGGGVTAPPRPVTSAAGGAR
jgi:hypothetical protein